ncbi:helix-turn-helix domain-containing protein [Nakamurella aerolata]|uniref:Helix-turn-helix transcriptional regulator n=1 Tax=Nakamurella aerolata TaxID=1656892 RepID=A0A849ACK0_9ACTN|nr:helix-turn-helix transcriptional regulator [Nakamurella aerolata]NNG36901.1 helix-turn-helix transcriptional regulator [Nakamurella aerolata]
MTAFDALGLGVDDPEVRDAVEDAEDYQRCVDALRTLRTDQRLTQQDVAHRMGARSQSVVSDIERMGSNPRIDTLQRYARAVGARLPLMPAVRKPGSCTPTSWATVHTVAVYIQSDDEDVPDEGTFMSPISTGRVAY